MHKDYTENVEWRTFEQCEQWLIVVSFQYLKIFKLFLDYYPVAFKN